ncbi:hypothetical protein JB92DRAFT_642772 [Gautieria morchelliformis]|nr:hypothetical protein JB92DRAFT_642772 [Gautieria morchelliformis]
MHQSPLHRLMSSDAPQLVADDAENAEEMKEAPLPPPSMSSPTLELPPVVASESHLISDTTSQSSHTSSRSPPTSMPIPAAPRRAGPPRKKGNLKAETMVQDQEPVEVPSVPAEAAEVVETPSSHSAMPQPPPAVSQGAEPEQDLSQQLDVTDSHEPVSDHASAPAKAEDRFTASAPVESIDDDELVRRDPEFSQEPVHEESQDVLADIAGESQMEDTHTPEVELETHAPTFTVPIVQDTKHVTETRDFEELPSSLVNEPEPHSSPTSDRAVNVERPVDTPAAHSSEPSLVMGTIISTAAVLAHEPAEVAAEDTETGTLEEQGESEPSAAVTEDQTDDEEADRRRRIAERLAKMGGRNPFSTSPFSATGPARKVSGDKPYETDNISSHEEFSVDEQNYNVTDIRH